jgi:hypothetical protein
MTLESYSPEELDQLALRALDVCGRLRRLAQSSREEDLDTITLHDKKALEWLSKLEEWIHKTEADLAVQALKNRGRKKAISLRGKNAGDAAV